MLTRQGQRGSSCSPCPPGVALLLLPRSISSLRGPSYSSHSTIRNIIEQVFEAEKLEEEELKFLM